VYCICRWFPKELTYPATALLTAEGAEVSEGEVEDRTGVVSVHVELRGVGLGEYGCKWVKALSVTAVKHG